VPRQPPDRRRPDRVPGGDAQRRDVERLLLAFDTDLAPIVGQQVTLDAKGAAVAVCASIG